MVAILFLVAFLRVTLAEQKCLTGLMTDVQSWVDEYGSLTDQVDKSVSLDLSSHTDPRSVLQTAISNVDSPLRNIKYLSVARCGLIRIPKIFDLRFATKNRTMLVETLEYLSFYGNQFIESSIAGVTYDYTLNATDVTEISFTNRQQVESATIWSSGFNGVVFKVLKELDLRACSIQNLGSFLFKNMKALEALYLSHNAIHVIQADAFAGLDNLLHLDLSRNFAHGFNGLFRSMLIDHADVFTALKSLKSLDLSRTRMNQRNVSALKNVGKSLERLSICFIGDLRFEENFLRGTSVKILDVSGISNILSSFNALHGLESTLEVLYATDTALNTFDVFENFEALKILKLSRNQITTVRQKTAVSLSNLKFLDLSSNRLNSWIQTVFSDIVSLEILDLSNNNINIISEEMMTDFASVSYLGLSSNSLVCNCRSSDLIKLAAINEIRTPKRLIPSRTSIEGRYSYHIGFDNVIKELALRRNISYLCAQGFCDNADLLNGTVLLLDYSSATYNCILTGESISMPMVQVKGCNEKRNRDLSSELATGRNKLFILLLLPCLLLPLALGFVFRRNLRYFCVTLKNSALIGMVNKTRIIDDDTIFNYDVFVSYCNEDRAWVLDQLLGHLERHCSISLCLHERDFQVGISILENIVSCMDRSKFILLVISKKFLLSHWCQFEMHLAQHRLLETRREDLILILLEEIPRRCRPNTLHYLMLTKTYIVWPKNKSDQHLFWKRLEKSVEAQKNKRKENVSLA